MNVFNFEMKSLVKSTVLWIVGLFILQFLFMSFFPIVSEDAEMMDLILKNYPKEMLKAFGMDELSSFGTALGYLGFIFVFVELCLAVQSAYLGFAFLSREERELTADFLMTKPITRKSIFFQKYLANVLVLGITQLVIGFSILLSLKIFAKDSTYEVQTLLAILYSIPLFQLAFFHIGMLTTVLTKKIRSVMSYAMAAAFGLYVLNAVRAITDGKLLGVISPYYHFEIARIVANEGIDFSRAWISIVFLPVSFVISYYLYQRRNIHSL